MSKILLYAALIYFAPAIVADADQPKPLSFSYVAIDGTGVDLSQMRGKVVVIFFWATWSQPSRSDIPVLAKVYKKYHETGFEVLGVSLDSDENTLQRYTSSRYMPWPEYFDARGTENEVAKTMGVKEIPSLWLIGKDGRVISVNANGDLDQAVEKALKAL